MLCPESSFLAPEIGILFGDAVGASLVRSPCCQLVVAMSESTKRGRSPNANKHKQPPSALMGRSTHKCIAKTCQRSEKLCIGSGFLLKAYDRSCCASVSSWSGSITSSTLISLNSSSLSNSSDACFFSSGTAVYALDIVLWDFSLICGPAGNRTTTGNRSAPSRTTRY